ncbi:nuclear apoptosis-inducing factor 1-like [Eriocheir sinensis]|uniref:nuclear apoptosis-inducing factor 1-like n=1 Tax=Eriocheir sinensis TaxID=95602 RepID=UPI0021C821E8|nr:nuclear apoptosis-inducing factor 1-like [Eriocheir sinensis]
MSSPPRKIQRRPRFTEAEILALVEEVERREHVILGKHDMRAGVTESTKRYAWEEVCDCVNAVSHVERSVEELKRKFRDLKAQVKSKSAAEMKDMGATGGGPPANVEYSEAELVLLRMQAPIAATGAPYPDSEGQPLRKYLF